MFQRQCVQANLTTVYSLSVPEQEQMCLLLREAMNVGKIALSQFFLSTELEPREARQRIKDELSGFCVVTEAPKTTFGKVFFKPETAARPNLDPNPLSHRVW